jgi:hypothetical protein
MTHTPPQHSTMAMHKHFISALALVSFLACTNAFVPRMAPSSKSLVSRTPSIRSAQQQHPLAPLSTTTTTALFAGDDDAEEEEVGPLGLAATALGLVAAPVVLYSEYVLKTTGCGLPAGPGGALGALEGISYLVVVGIAGASIYKKVKTGTGLPAGPAGLLGAVEGLSFLAVLVGAVVLGLTIKDFGSVPEAVPVDGGRCSGI